MIVPPPLQHNLQEVYEKNNSINKPYLNGDLTKKESRIEKKNLEIFLSIYIK